MSHAVSVQIWALARNYRQENLVKQKCTSVEETKNDDDDEIVRCIKY